jgi:hypothetical protein
MQKKVARTFRSASSASNAGVFFASGPSSNVNATIFRFVTTAQMFSPNICHCGNDTPKPTHKPDRSKRREPAQLRRAAKENENQRRRAERDAGNHLVSGQARTQHIPFVPVGEKVNSATVRQPPGKVVLSIVQCSGAISPRTKPTAVRKPKADAEWCSPQACL